MPGFNNRLAFVVPTKDHPKLLHHMLTSLVNQTHLPDQTIIVDGGDETVEDVAGKFPTLHIKYLRVYPPSLAKQRNAGMAVVDPSITLAGYLDDDLILEPDSIEAMLRFWQEAPEDVGGARFNIYTDPFPKATWLKSLFLIDSPNSGRVLRSGHSIAIGPVTDTKFTDWLSGGATIWRKAVVDEFAYDEWFDGTGYLEDVDYSYRVRKKYRLAVIAEAKVQHFSSPVKKEMNFTLGKWQVINRMYFIKKHSELSQPLFYWSILGNLVLNLGTAFVRRDSGLLRRAWGNCVGLLTVARGKTQRISGVWK